MEGAEIMADKQSNHKGKTKWRDSFSEDNPSGVLGFGGSYPEPWWDIVRGHDGDGVGILTTPERLAETVGERIQSARTSIRHTETQVEQEDGTYKTELKTEYGGIARGTFAEMAGLGDRTLKEIEAGSRELRVSELFKLAEVLRVHPLELLGIANHEELSILRNYSKLDERGRRTLVDIAEVMANPRSRNVWIYEDGELKKSC